MSPLVLLQDKGVHPGPARARPSEQDEAGADIKVAAGAGGLHVLAPAALMFRCRRLGRPPLPSCKGGRRRRRATARIEPKLHGPQRATGMPAVSLVPRGESSPWGPTSPTKNVGCRLKGDHPNARAAGDRALVAAARQGVPSRRRRQRRNLRRRRGLSSPVEGDQRVQRRLRGDRPNAVVARGGPSSPVEGRRRGAGVDGRGGRPNPRAVESMEPGESISRIPKGHRNVGSLACLTKITQGQSNLWELGIAERRPR